MRRVRLADTCGQAGLSLEGIGEAIAAHAGPGQVLVSDQVLAECPAGPAAFEPIARCRSSGVTDPVPLHRATRSE